MSFDSEDIGCREPQVCSSPIQLHGTSLHHPSSVTFKGHSEKSNIVNVGNEYAEKAKIPYKQRCVV